MSDYNSQSILRKVIVGLTFWLLHFFQNKYRKYRPL